MKIISSAALHSLKEALSKIYWYKKDLRGFLTNAIENAEILSHLNWDDTKRDIVSNLVDYCARNQIKYQDALIKLIREVTRMNDFSHLERLEDGDAKANSAQSAVAALKKLSANYEKLVGEQQLAEERRVAAHKGVPKIERVKNLRDERCVSGICSAISSKDCSR